MSREKQIEEMWNIITTDCDGRCVGCEFENNDWCFTHFAIKKLYDAGYRKQTEGVWIYNPDGIDWGLGSWQCSLCGCNNHNLPQDKGTNPLVWAGSKYCPNCGAKMKGGGEE